MAHSYAHVHGLAGHGPALLHRLRSVGQAPTWRFTSSRGAIFENRPIAIFNNGNMRRDFTYIDDIAEGVFAGRSIARLRPIPPGTLDNLKPPPVRRPYRLYNIGNSQPVEPARFRISAGKRSSAKPGHSGSSSRCSRATWNRDLRRYFGTSARCRIFRPRRRSSRALHRFGGLVSLLSRRGKA